MRQTFAVWETANRRSSGEVALEAPLSLGSALSRSLSGPSGEG